MAFVLHILPPTHGTNGNYWSGSFFELIDLSPVGTRHRRGPPWLPGQRNVTVYTLASSSPVQLKSFAGSSVGARGYGIGSGGLGRVRCAGARVGRWRRRGRGCSIAVGVRCERRSSGGLGGRSSPGSFFSPLRFLVQEPGRHECQRLVVVPAEPVAGLGVAESGFAFRAWKTFFNTVFCLG